MNELVKTIKELNIKVYNTDYYKFTKIMKNIFGEDTHDSYIMEKWETFRNEGLGFINFLDDNNAEKFLEELMK